MDVQGKNALANLLNGADPPSQGSLVKKDDDGGFDAALGMALFAHPSFVLPPNQITDAGRDRVETPDQAALLAGTSAVAGDNTPRATDYDVRQSLAQNLVIDNGDTAGPRPAAAATASFEDFAASLLADGNAPLTARSGERQTSVIDLVAGGAPSPSAAVSVSLEGTSSSPAGTEPADDPRGLTVSDPKPLDDPRGLTVDDLKPMDDSRGLPVGDLKPLGDSRGLPVDDSESLFSQSDNHLQSTTGDAAASATRQVGPAIGDKALHQGLPSKPVTELPAHDVSRTIGGKAPGAGSVLNLTGPTAPTSHAQERTLHVEAPAAPAFEGSQPKPAAPRANAPDAEKGMAVTRLGGQPSADASGRQTASISDAQGKSASSDQIPDLIDPPNRPTLSDDNKHGPASRTDSTQPASHRSGAGNGIAPATTSVSDSHGGASRPVAGPAPTPRTIATPDAVAKIANLRIDLAAGQSTHATVRERSGAVDVRIVADDQQNAQLIGSEIPSLRRALDAAGMQLKTADVQHQGGGGERRQDERQQPTTTDRRWQSGRGGGESIFAIEEVRQ